MAVTRSAGTCTCKASQSLHSATVQKGRGKLQLSALATAKILKGTGHNAFLSDMQRFGSLKLEGQGYVTVHACATCKPEVMAD